MFTPTLLIVVVLVDMLHTHTHTQKKHCFYSPKTDYMYPVCFCLFFYYVSFVGNRLQEK